MGKTGALAQTDVEPLAAMWRRAVMSSRAPQQREEPDQRPELCAREMAEGGHRRFGVNEHAFDDALGHHGTNVRERWPGRAASLVADAVARQASGLLRHLSPEVELGKLGATGARDGPRRSDRQCGSATHRTHGGRRSFGCGRPIGG